MTAPKLVLLGSLLLLCGCSQLQETGRAMYEYNGALMDSQEEVVAPGKFRITVYGSSALFEGQAEQFFNRRADEYTHQLGCPGWTLLEFKMGIENTLFSARRYATGVVQCNKAG